MKCEDCGGPVTGTPDECQALVHGLRICQSCLDSMEEERDAYEQIMADEGYRCEFDPETGRFRSVPISKEVRQ